MVCQFYDLQSLVRVQLELVIHIRRLDSSEQRVRRPVFVGRCPVSAFIDWPCQKTYSAGPSLLSYSPASFDLGGRQRAVRTRVCRVYVAGISKLEVPPGRVPPDDPPTVPTAGPGVYFMEAHKSDALRGCTHVTIPAYLHRRPRRPSEVNPAPVRLTVRLRAGVQVWHVVGVAMSSPTAVPSQWRFRSLSDA